MGPDEDDGEEFEPLPDPTLRSWRHPSELAAVAAMAASGEPLPRRRGLAPGSLALGAALGVVAVVGLMVTTDVLGTDTASPRVQFREAPLLSPTPTTPTTTTPTTATPTTATPTTATPTTATPTTVAPSTTATDEAAGRSETVAALPATTVTESATVPSPDPVPVVSAGVADRALIGVVAGGDDEPAGTAFALDAMIVTSASAIGSASEVTIVVAGDRHEVAVLGRDRFTDVAVLVPPPGVELVELPPADGVGVDEPVTLMATDGRPEPIAVLGRVTGVQRSGATPGGHPLLGLVTTTARLPEPGAGALLLDAEGALVGMVVDGPDHLAAAVPHDVVRQVARSLVETGHPAGVWVGISVLEHERGVLLAGVQPDGPAARAGLRAGDVVVAMAGSRVTDRGAFIAALRAHSPGDQVDITVERRGEPLSSTLTIGAPRPRPAPRLQELAAN